MIGRLYHRKEVREIARNLALLEKEQTITSLEVAEMVGKRHDHLIRDIKKYIGELNAPNVGEARENGNPKVGVSPKVGEGKIPHTDFFIESTYMTDQNKSMPCYEVTKKGCEFIAHKLTGVKGTKFTARYINRFHDMEDYIKQSGNKTSIEKGISIVKFIADDLNVNTASRLLMYENYCKDVGVPTGFLPKYEHNDSRQLKALTSLLKENGCELSAVKFNQKLIECGYVEERERTSSKGSGKKKFKALTESGLKYGENAVSPHNQKEVQPLYYSDTFMELYKEVTK